MTRVLPGLEVLLSDQSSRIAGKRIGLVTHQSAVTGDLQHAVPLLHGRREWTLAALFGPEHGIWGEAQDMAHVAHSDDPLTGLTVYSLYGQHEEDLKPRREVLSRLDALLIDLQERQAERWVRNARGEYVANPPLPHIIPYFTRLQLNGHAWQETATRDPRQPSEGMTIPADTRPSERKLICDVYERVDGSGRQLIRLIAEAVCEFATSPS